MLALSLIQHIESGFNDFRRALPVSLSPKLGPFLKVYRVTNISRNMSANASTTPAGLCATNAVLCTIKKCGGKANLSLATNVRNANASDTQTNAISIHKWRPTVEASTASAAWKVGAFASGVAITRPASTASRAKRATTGLEKSATTRPSPVGNAIVEASLGLRGVATTTRTPRGCPRASTQGTACASQASGGQGAIGAPKASTTTPSARLAPVVFPALQTVPVAGLASANETLKADGATGASVAISHCMRITRRAA